MSSERKRSEGGEEQQEGPSEAKKARLDILRKRRFGTTPPSLLEFLKKVLREYTDGQIMKEIVQNAEDAGAKTVRFLYDYRQHGTDHLIWPSMAEYQGSALYAYNDALFQEKDWEGIQKPARSNKEADPLKVGRFGIGFSSIYHLTDLPSILSGETLAFIDPLKNHFGDEKTGERLNVNDHDIIESSDFADQFTPYSELFLDAPYHFTAGQEFPGTVFRFPIRQRASKLCNKTYNDSDMSRLLESFVDDVEVVMLFLRSLERIEISKRIDQRAIDIASLVEICPESLESIRSEKQRFSQALKDNYKLRPSQRTRICLTNNLPLKMHVGNNEKRMDWVVSQLIGGSEMPDTIVNIAEEQGYIPWVGVAMPCNGHSEEFAGRVFCFLPLPPGNESLTGLPVHIHGFFGVNSDRRSIKWPGADRVHGDVDAQWNFLLATKLLPDAYVGMLNFAIRDQGLSSEEVYRAWPNLDKVRPQWERLLQPVFQSLCQQAAIYATNGKWMKVEDVVFNFLSDDGVDENTQQVLLKILNAANIPIATVPSHVKKVVRRKDLSNVNVSTISPEMIIDCIHKSQHTVLKDMSSGDKLLLLEYLMERVNATQLIGLRLLPLANGDFIQFSPRSDLMVYIPHIDLNIKLTYNMGERLILPNIGTGLTKLLEKMAVTGCLQLQMMTDKDFAGLIRKTLPSAWFTTRDATTVVWHPDKKYEPPRGWLESIWTLLKTSARKSLDKFVNLPLIQVREQNEEVVLAFLRENSTCIAATHGSDALGAHEAKMLTRISIVVCSCPTFIDTSRLVADGYLKNPSGKGVLAAMEGLSDRKLLKCQVNSLSTSERETLLNWFSSCALTETEKELIRGLPLFETVPISSGSHGRVVCAGDNKLFYSSVQVHHLPQPLLLEYDLICTNDRGIIKVLSDLGVAFKSKTDLLTNVIDAIHSGLYVQDNLRLVTLWILSNLKECKNMLPQHLVRLQTYPFVLTPSGVLKSPESLFDPSDRNLILLLAEDSFPNAMYKEEGVLSSLCEFGLKHKTDVTSTELAAVTEVVSEQQSIDKAKALMLHLEEFPEILRQPIHKDDTDQLVHFMANKRYIPCLQEPPSFYPKHIPWHKVDDGFISPNETVIGTKANILINGASLPFVRDIPIELQRHIGIKEHPRQEYVIKQLAACSSSDRTLIRSEETKKLEKMINALYHELSVARGEIIEEIKMQVSKSVWTGLEFVEVHHATLSDQANDFHPYMSCIRPEFRKYEGFFEALGVGKCLTPNQLIEIIQQINKDEPTSGSTEDRTAFRQKCVPMVNKILTLLTDMFTRDEFRRVSRSILVPTNNMEYLELVEPDRCAFIDAGVSLNLGIVQLERENVFILDDTLSLGTANALGVQPLSHRVLDAEELVGVEQAGQYEPLTTRIKNILKNSYLETSVPKEMIQNAEDAGASRVHFMLDMRDNVDACSTLFDKGMKECQGPALWIYNDALFTLEDFENVTKLGGATKEQDSSKIGRFGLGFNSVYHLTDVPSFISGKYLQVFDPHTTHLGSMLKDKGSPGIRVDLQKNSNMYALFRDQFAPYNGVFDCQLDQNSSPYYNGTLFRLPLRSREISFHSQLCDQYYDECRAKSLLINMWASCEDLLVFTKKVREIKVCAIPANANGPSEVKDLFTVTKQSDCDRDVIDEFKQCHTETKHPEQIKPVVKHECITRTVTSHGKDYLQLKEGVKSSKMMSVSCIGTKASYELWKTQEGQRSGLDPVGGVAVSLPLSVKTDGKLFCGLPLSVPATQLPCDCNGAFAISTDRRHLWKSSIDTEENYFTKWNHALFQDVICKAYICLLTNKDFQRNLSGVNSSSETFYSLWPDDTNFSPSSDGYAMLDGFYRTVTAPSESSQNPTIFWEGKDQWSFTEAIFIDPEFQDNANVASVVRKVLEECNPKQFVTELPLKTRSTLCNLGFGDFVSRQTCDELSFFQQIFLPRISTFAAHIRDPLVQYCLAHEKLCGLLEDIACIPVTPSGETMKSPGSLIDPHGKASPLYAEEDERFPHGSYADTNCLLKLRDLGMVVDNVSTRDFLDRAERLARTSVDREKDQVLFDYLMFRITSTDSSWYKDQSFCRQLQHKAFIPVIYKGSSIRRASCDIIYAHEKESLVNEVASVFDAQNMQVPEKVQTFLGIQGKPPVRLVLDQLMVLISRDNRGNVMKLLKVCGDIYRYLDLMIREGREVSTIQEFFQSNKSILVGISFVGVNQLARKFEEERVGEHLFRVPTYMREFSALQVAIGIRMSFTAHDIASALNAIHLSNKGPLSSIVLEEVMKLVRYLEKYISEESLEKSGVRPQDIFLPDKDGSLTAANELSFCDIDWIPVTEVGRSTHRDIPLSWAKTLGVRDIRQQILSTYSSPVPGLSQIEGGKVRSFGQREILTTRIKRILSGYPCDDTILKELVQNADDTQASEVHLLLDLRTHSKKRLFRDTMSELQGPALCVYNNRPFTDDDIEGIQRLGEGSKSNHSTKVGRFGVGFNAVYHLTDCPSFFTNGDTLCIFDPNVKYVPNATVERPGFMARPVDQKLKDDFPNVFDCYLPKRFQPEGATMFRLPLRTEAMAKVSEISSQPISPDKMTELMQKFKTGLPEMLLFLQNVKRVSLSTIDEEGDLVCTYTVNASLLDTKQEDVDAFMTAVAREGEESDAGKRKSLEDIPVTCAHYTMRVSVEETNTSDETDETPTHSEDWFVHQQHGFSYTSEIPPKVQEAYDKGILQVLPIGGVAVPLSDQQLSSRAYCFLPLPIDTGLPVHVNGYFELDHELRRNLWDESEDARGQWNQQVIKQIVAPAYVNAICHLRSRVEAEVGEEHDESLLKKTAARYAAIFPTTAENRFWRELVITVYRNIANCTVPLFPVIKRIVSHGDNVQSIDWRMPFLTAQRPGFFDTSIKENSILRSVVADVGFPLVECPTAVHSAIEQSIRTGRLGDVKVLDTSPEDLLEHLSGRSTHEVGLGSHQLPRNLSKTVIKDKVRLQAIMRYCGKLDTFNNRLENIPLLLTSDKQLRIYSVDTPVFSTYFHDLFPSSRDRFLHPWLMGYVRDDANVICRCAIPDLASMITKEMNPSTYCRNRYVQWNKNKRTPTAKWISRLWKYLAEIGADYDAFQPLASWSILPSRKVGPRRNTCYLVPLSKASSVMKELSDTSDLHAALKVIGVCEVDLSIGLPPLTSNFATMDGQPERILSVFDHIIESNPEALHRMQPIHRDRILQYFALNGPERVMKANARNQEIVMSLPCYKQLDGTYTSLVSSSSVYIVERGIPRSDAGKWMAKHDAKFLTDSDVLKKLYTAIGCCFIAECDVLSKFIFPQFSTLSRQARKEYLKCAQYILETSNSGKRAQLIKDMDLKACRLLEDIDCNLKQGKDFFDHKNEVFMKMLPNSKFLSKEVRQGIHDVFLQDLGVQAEVTTELFLRFAREVSTASKLKNRHEQKLAEQSTSLVHELFRNCDLHANKSFLASIRTMSFIIPDSPDKGLLSLHQYHMGTSAAMQFENSVTQNYLDIVWSSSNVLPKYIHCDIRTPTDCSHQKDDILGKLHVPKQPDLHKVIENVNQVCHSVHDQGNLETIKMVMNTSYKFLQSACDRYDGGPRCKEPLHLCDTCKLMSEMLRDSPCVLIKGVLVKPSEVCRVHGKLFQPHLYQLPDSLVPFDSLFQCLGSTQDPSFSQLAAVLNGLASHSVKGLKNPNMRLAIKTACVEFFKGIKEMISTGSKVTESVLQSNLLKVHVIHFPTSPYGKLVQSTKTFINDDDEVAKRFRTTSVHFLLEEVIRPFTDISELIAAMPDNVKPRSISKCAKEKMDNTTSATPCPCERIGICAFSKRMNGLIASNEFKELLKCLASRGNTDTGRTSIQQRVEKVKNLRMKCKSKLPTIMHIDGIKIEGSQAMSTCYMAVDDEDLCVYVKHADEKERSMYMQSVKGLTGCISHYIGFQHDQVALIEEALMGDSNQAIKDIIQRQKLFDTDKESKQEDALAPPKLGTRIPKDILHLLERDLYAQFYKGEYVAYEVENDSAVHEIPVYIYAQIVDAPDNLLPPLHKQYSIDIGEENVFGVNGISLYKFLKPELDSDDEDLSLVPYSVPPGGQESQVPREPEPYPEDIEEAKHQVTRQLEEIWKLDEDMKRKAIKRLYLRWHPDKHPSKRQHLATEVFKHLQAEIERLKSGKPRDKTQGGSSGKRSSRRGRSFFNKEFFDFMRNWAKEERRQRESYRERYRERGYFHSTRSSYCPPSFDDTPEPDIPKAKAWFRQAEYDYESGKNDTPSTQSSNVAYEWICYKCYHAAEKALKAAQLATRGEIYPSDNLEVLASHLGSYFQSKIVSDSARQLCRIVKPSTCLYPVCRILSTTIPRDQFTLLDAENALQDAGNIITEVRGKFKF